MTSQSELACHHYLQILSSRTTEELLYKFCGAIEENDGFLMDISLEKKMEKQV